MYSVKEQEAGAGTTHLLILYANIYCVWDYMKSQYSLYIKTNVKFIQKHFLLEVDLSRKILHGVWIVLFYVTRNK